MPSDLSIIHHGRDRERLLERVWPVIGKQVNPITQGLISRIAQRPLELLTPPDETKILRSSIGPYIDFHLVNDDEFIYDQSEVQSNIDQLPIYTDGRFQLSREDQQWLLGRGVTQEQLVQFYSCEYIRDERARIVLGIEIHPALQRWIGHTWPRGVIHVARNHQGDSFGTHLRLLSTVPKLKFGSACPMMYIDTNIHRLEDIHEIWLVEGVFDALALDSIGKAYITPSSGFWAPEQLFQMVDTIITRSRDIERIICAHDRDRVGTKENLFLWSVLRRLKKFKVDIYAYADGIKDMAELICKHQLNPDKDGQFEEPSQVAERYLRIPYEPIVDFNIYLDNRNTVYSNDLYQWVELP